jgi:hypothetical protein
MSPDETEKILCWKTSDPSRSPRLTRKGGPKKIGHWMENIWMENAFTAYIPFIAYDEKNRKKFEGASRATPAFSAAFSFAYDVMPLLPFFGGHSF